MVWMRVNPFHTQI